MTIVSTTFTGYTLAYQNMINEAQTSVTQMNPAYSINVLKKANIGSYLTNATGWTLYTFAQDIGTNGISNCAEACIKNWPAFYVSNMTVAPGLNATSFRTITRSDGTKQISYDGWPLYFFRNDTKPGDTNGQGVAGAWYACTFPTPFTVTSRAIAPTTTTTKATTSS